MCTGRTDIFCFSEMKAGKRKMKKFHLHHDPGRRATTDDEAMPKYVHCTIVGTTCAFRLAESASYLCLRHTIGCAGKQDKAIRNGGRCNASPTAWYTCPIGPLFALAAIGCVGGVPSAVGKWRQKLRTCACGIRLGVLENKTRQLMG